MNTESLGVIILSPRAVATGSPAGSALENIITTPLADGAMCYVESGPGQGLWQFEQNGTGVPDGVTIVAPIGGPGRWFIKLLPGPGGGGGGTITSLSGTGGITITNPLGPAAVVNGGNLYARNGSNGAMLANMSMGGFGITNVTSVASAGALTVSAAGALTVTSAGSASVTAGGALSVSSTGALSIAGSSLTLDGGVDVLTWPSSDGTAGQALVTDGAGNLSFATVSATPAPPANSIQYNNAGAFGGSPQLTFVPAAAGIGPEVVVKSSSNTDAGSGFIIQDSLGNVVANFSFSEDPLPANYFTTLAGSGFFQIDAFSGDLQLKAFGNLTLTRGAVSWQWPAADGTSGQALVTDGAGNLSFAGVSAAPTLQIITVAGPTAVTNTEYTVALVNFAGAAAVVLPAPTAGKRMTVKDTSGNAATNNITITSASGNLDGTASKIIATNYGSLSFIGDGTNWWVI